MQPGYKKGAATSDVHYDSSKNCVLIRGVKLSLLNWFENSGAIRVLDRRCWNLSNPLEPQTVLNPEVKPRSSELEPIR